MTHQRGFDPEYHKLICRAEEILAMIKLECVSDELDSAEIDRLRQELSHTVKTMIEMLG